MSWFVVMGTPGNCDAQTTEPWSSVTVGPAEAGLFAGILGRSQ